METFAKNKRLNKNISRIPIFLMVMLRFLSIVIYKGCDCSCWHQNKVCRRLLANNKREACIKKKRGTPVHKASPRAGVRGRVPPQGCNVGKPYPAFLQEAAFRTRTRDHTEKHVYHEK